MKAQLLVIDPPYSFSDKLSMSDVKRSPESQYKSVLDNHAILNLKVSEISADDAVLALWVPSTLIEFGLECMKAYGFEFKQTWIWVKSKKEPLGKLKKQIKKAAKKKADIDEICGLIDNFDLNDSLNFYMGRIFRQTHEVCLIGVRGKVHKSLKNKSQVSVFIGPNPKHSEKPEALQDRLEKMYPDYVKRLELFARRGRTGWSCWGNECENSLNMDIRESIEKYRNL
jgi:N6-adenosine-specific RNA methylase IME4